MRSLSPTTRAALALASMTLCAVALSAQSLSRLPAGIALPRSADSRVRSRSCTRRTWTPPGRIAQPATLDCSRSSSRSGRQAGAPRAR